MRALVFSSVMVLVVRALGIIAQSAIIIVLARTLPIQEMGIFAISYAILGLARMLGPLGMDQFCMRQVARDIDNGQISEETHRSLNASVIVVFVVSSILGLALLAISFIGSKFLTTGPNIQFRLGMTLLAAALPAFSLIGLITLQLRGFGQQARAQIPDSLILQLIFGMCLWLAHHLNSLDLNGVMVSVTVSAWIITFIYLFLRLRVGVMWIVPVRGDFVRLFRESHDILWGLSLTAISARAPLFLSAWLLGPAATATLDISTRFGTLPSITTSSVMAGFSPRFAALDSPGREAELSRTLSVSSILAVVPAVLCLAAIAAGGPYAIRWILPSEYAHVYWPMLLICASQIANASFGPTTNMLVMLGKENVVRNFSLIQLVVTIGLCLLLAHPFGLLGIAGAIFVGQVCRDLGAAVWAYRKVGTAIPPFDLARKCDGPNRP